MVNTRFLPALLALVCSVAAAGELRVLRHETITDWRSAAVSGEAVAGKPGLDDDAPQAFTAFGRRFVLELETNARLQSAIPASGARYRLYKGRIAGTPGSWLRLTKSATGWQGVISDGEHLYGVEPASALAGLTDTPPAGGGPVIYRYADMLLDPAALACAAAPEAPNAGTSATLAERFGKLTGELEALAATAPTQAIDVAVLADPDFAARHGDPEAALASRLNIVDGIFSEQVGVAISVVEFRVFTDANDPISDTTDSNDLLDEVGFYKSRQSDLSGLGLVHFYTGRNIADAAGIAFRASLCSARFGAGVSEGTRTLNTDSLIAAHEIGHNFGAPHDGESGSPCESTPQTFLMAPNINGSSRFSACSLEQIDFEVSTAACLRPLDNADVSLAVTSATAEIDEGGSATVELTVTSEGNTAATGVDVRLAFPGGLTLGQTGECVASAGGADCDLGTIAAGSSATLSVPLTGVAPGDFTVDATVSADENLRSDNDTDSMRILVRPSVDLAIALGGAATLEEGETAVVTAEVVNADDASAASALDVGIDFPAGLAIVGVTPTAGQCSIGAASVSCTAASLAAGASLGIEVTVAGETAGAGTIAASVGAAEADPLPANNAATRQIEITQAAASGGGGGSGGGGSGGSTAGEPAGSSGGGAASYLLLFSVLASGLRAIAPRSGRRAPRRHSRPRS